MGDLTSTEELLKILPPVLVVLLVAVLFAVSA